MIGRIAGRLEYRGADHVLIDVRGVGYVVHVSERTLAALPAPGAAVALHTELVVREDLLQLFGFATLAEKEWHRLLMTVQGVGAKAAMAILSALGAEGVSRALALGDWAAVARARGVGPKTAQRVVLDLKDKAPAVMAMGVGLTLATVAEDGLPEPAPAPAARRAAKVDEGESRRAAASADALSALVNLGYGQGDAAQAVVTVAGDLPDADAAALIRAALRLLAPR
jgi:Holliday junction DNA helicase RuvA